MNSPTMPHQPSPPPAGPVPLLDKLRQQYQDSPLESLLNQLPAAVKSAGTRAVARYQNLSTAQKVVGSVLLLLAVRRLTRGGKSRP